MTYATHKQYAVLFGLVANIFLYAKGITEIDYFIALPIVMMTAKAGALFPDIDHNWKNVKEKTVINWVINKIIHITGGKHRSWQTHSIDIVVYFTLFSIFFPEYLLNKEVITLVNKEVLSILLLGFTSGWISHIFSDMWTSAGVRLICFNSTKLAFVPSHIGKLRFNTGNEWEAFCYKTVRIINIILGIWAIIYPFVTKYDISVVTQLMGKLGGLIQ